MNTSLIAISIGPVQEFIRAARKTRDLWFGSRMLSRIAWAAATELDKHADLIFPDPGSLGAGVPAPNKLLAILKEGEDPPTVADTVKDQAQRVLDDYLGSLVNEHGPAIDTTLAARQVEHFLEYYAAWVPIERHGDDAAASATAYAAARREVELLLAGRKAVRDFAPPPPASAVARDKSALDPGRDNVVTHDVTDVERGQLKLRGKERLDAISLIKRTQGRDDERGDRFVSTSRVAIDPFIRRLVRDSDTWLTRLNTLASGKGPHAIGAERFNPVGDLAHYAVFPYDTQLFYDPRPDDPELAKVDSARKAAESFYLTATEASRDLPGIVELPAYFAVVHADGDRMGKLIGALSDVVPHQRFSWHSAQFASHVNKLAVERKGALVYSGGDDVLAFLPLDQALPFAAAIRDAFETTMRELTGDEKLKGVRFPEQMPTLSVGVAIGHAGEHLQRLVEWSRKTEKLAKDSGRNALAVAFHPRGVAEAAATAVHSWSEEPVDTWSRWLDYHRRDILPDGAAYELRELAARFTGIDAAVAGVMIGLERDRILKRKRGERGRRPLTTGELRALRTADVSSVAQLRRLADELIISREIAKAIDTASGPLPPAREPGTGNEVAA